MSDDLTTAYLLGAEQMRDKLHKQADAIERLQREAAIRIDQIGREQDAHLRTIADYNRVAVENDKLRKALKAILDDAGYHNPMRMTTEISDKILEDAAGALHDKNV